MKVNNIDTITPTCLEGRRFLVIPSNATYRTILWDSTDGKLSMNNS